MTFFKYLVSIFLGLLIGFIVAHSNISNKFLKYSYMEEQFPRLINDVTFLAKLVDRSIKREQLLAILRKNSDGSYIQNIKDYNHHIDKRVKSSITGNGLHFYFDNAEQLIRIEHWHSNAGTILE